MSKLLIDESPLQVLPKLAVAIGLNEAIIIQQIHYWLGRSGTNKDGHQWVYNTVQQWQEQFPFWSPDTVRRALASLKESGLLVGKKLSENRFDKTLFYRIDYEQLAIIEYGNLQSYQDSKLPSRETAKTSGLYKTETTTETTKPNAQDETAFETFWDAGMVKTGKKKALSIFTSIVKRDKLDASSFAEKLAEDVRARLQGSQFGFDKLHPTTYLNGERWSDALPAPSANAPGGNERMRTTYDRTADIEAADRLNAAAGVKPRGADDDPGEF